MSIIIYLISVAIICVRIILYSFFTFLVQLKFSLPGHVLGPDTRSSLLVPPIDLAFLR